MCIFIFVYQLSYKTNKIDELNKVVESQREITEDIVKKNYPSLENKINDIVNIEKYKKLNNDLKDENSGINYLKNKVLDDMKNANRLRTYRNYDDLLKQKNELYIQVSNLINNKLTINTLNELNQQNQPLHKQIQYLETKVKNNYQNKLIQSNNLKKLKANEKIKYVLLKLDKYDAPLQEQMDAINHELKKFDKSLLSKNHNLEINYNNNTKAILEHLKQNNQPIENQIEALKRTLENQKLLLEIEKLKRELANNLNAPKYIVDISNLQKALDNLQKIKNDTTGKYDPNTKDILQKPEQSNKPLEDQINNLKRELDKTGANNLQKALDNLQKIKNDTTGKYDPNTKDILQKLDQTNKPLEDQINNLKKELNNTGANNLQKALDNLQKIKNDTTGKYDPNTKDILQKLDQTNKPLEDQINNLKKELNKSLNPMNQDKELKEQIKALEKQINEGSVLKDPSINKEKIEKALDNLENIKNSNIKDLNTPSEKVYRYKLKDALDGIKEIQKIENQLSSNKSSKPTLNKDIDKAIKYLEDKMEQPNLKPDKDIRSTLDKFNIKDVPTPEQLGDLYSNLYSTPEENTNISELNFVINRLNEQKDLEDKIKDIDTILEKIDKPINSLPKDSVAINSNKEIADLKNKIKYLQKKIEKNGVVHLPCLLDNEGTTMYLFKLYLRDDNMYVQLGWQDGIEELTKGLPNLDKLVDQTMTLNTFMKLTKPIFEQTVQDECRHFVYFEDETISKREYKRKTLTIQHHFYKYIDHIW
ncbi:MAG: hypothetical protein GW919_03770 [Epsilonproteobacteria bacterium]|nr:hypothetical protein [Campylobacterota bacterium]PIU36069.1 MAG: hypothetical protein COT05_01040 [Sulfurimonas sp. CG07_land_8_20_14_0_80_36_56]PIV04414.1 MAG: hypothetical protein COS56_05155 [Sulfurimonas sp. CG03_land_8_20_14_0_80_36_25]PIW53228.1 MAG: hypothetical protein COW17_04185 [Sulfurimonas sp. CG12_big_fil_rev_8_21_14_0_65_36_1453]PIX66165.1 MAG: hypothetical protein COZ44_00555 [Sulfurimonas sp. CG_4_10_14_3_um_filter_36_910]PJC25960.1 MAG: hypothetical protein CO055_10115 [Su